MHRSINLSTCAYPLQWFDNRSSDQRDRRHRIHVLLFRKESLNLYLSSTVEAGALRATAPAISQTDTAFIYQLRYRGTGTFGDSFFVVTFSLGERAI